MKVVFTFEAEFGLERIGDVIAADSPERAMSFIAELREKALALAEFPQAFPLVQRYVRLGIRRRAHGDYIILYRVEDTHVVILHIVHGAMDYIRLLGVEDDGNL